MRRSSSGTAALLCCSGAVHAAEQPGPAAAGSLLQVVLGLIVVLGLMAAAAWALKRFGVAKPAGGTTVKIVGGVSVGNRERILVVEVAGQWIVVGVAAGRVSALATMPRQENAAAPPAAAPPNHFAARFKRALEQRHGN
ncbi:flagellar biosynthetic protein FliO [Polaromonas sp. AET17H-212]|uniref:flagellar biosynthetic protein FliO n=1 Tax=Polaromonas sp. AET17H-212 TaxID=1977061 RepID=UPI000BBBB405|nr:flagellar biosynthetic protein FliO [Polaromonas sp. AET17H-212]